MVKYQIAQHVFKHNFDRFSIAWDHSSIIIIIIIIIITTLFYFISFGIYFFLHFSRLESNEKLQVR